MSVTPNRKKCGSISPYHSELTCQECMRLNAEDFHERNARTGVTAPDDPVNHPKHYNSHPSGVECITITRHMGFNIGNAIKYLWRADEKGKALQDLEKAAWYIADEIKRRKQG